jgi:hypothetical protein
MTPFASIITYKWF